MELGTITGKVLEILRSEDESFADIQMWGAPAECGRLVIQSTNRELEAIFTEYGITAQELVAEVEARTSEKWVYTTGLQVVADRFWFNGYGSNF